MDQGDYASLSSNDFIEVIKSQSLAMNVIHPDIPEKKIAAPVQSQPKKVEIKTPSPSKIVAPKPVEQPKVKQVIDEQPKVETKPAPVQKTTPTPSVAVMKYHIIIASLETQRDAQATIATMESKGLHNLKIKEGNGHFRIVLKSFEDKNAAYSKLNELKQQDEYKNAWLLCSK